MCRSVGWRCRRRSRAACFFLVAEDAGFITGATLSINDGRSSHETTAGRAAQLSAQAMLPIVRRNRASATAKKIAPIAASASNCGHTTSNPAPR